MWCVHLGLLHQRRMVEHHVDMGSVQITPDVGMAGSKKENARGDATAGRDPQ